MLIDSGTESMGSLSMYGGTRTKEVEIMSVINNYIYVKRDI